MAKTESKPEDRYQVQFLRDYRFGGQDVKKDAFRSVTQQTAAKLQKRNVVKLVKGDSPKAEQRTKT